MKNDCNNHIDDGPVTPTIETNCNNHTGAPADNLFLLQENRALCDHYHFNVYLDFHAH